MLSKSPKKCVFTCFSLSLFILLTCPIRSLQAQVVETIQQNLPPPQDIQPSIPLPQPSLELPQQLPSPQLPPPLQPIPPLEEAIPNSPAAVVVVKRFDIVGSTVFNQEKLSKVLSGFLNRPLTLKDLYEARSRITDLYISNGYITSGAYIPPQSIESGVVKIQVVEGKLESIEIIGLQRLSSNYVRERILTNRKLPINQKHLIEALQLLQLNPLIQNVSAELKEGTRPGTNIIKINIEEADSFSSQVTLDNNRTPSAGSFQRRLQLTEANLLGLGDSLSVSYSNTDGSNSFNGNYTLPLNPKNGTLSFSYGTAESNIIEPPFNILNIEGYSRYYELTFRQPIVQTPTQEFALGLTISRRESEVSYRPPDEKDRIAFPSLGADEEGRTRISALQFFQEWTSRSSSEVLAVRTQFNLGIGALNATINQDAPDSRFFSWQGQAQWARLLAPDTLMLLRLNTQLTTTSLVPFEQFGLGGIDSVRGYRQDYLLIDKGVFASAEVRIPTLRTSENGLLQVAPFADFGIGWNNSNTDNLPSNTTNTLVSVGLGLRFSQGDRFTARLDWGIPLVGVDSTTDRTWQENGLYFSLIYNPF